LGAIHFLFLFAIRQKQILKPVLKEVQNSKEVLTDPVEELRQSINVKKGK